MMRKTKEDADKDEEEEYEKSKAEIIKKSLMIGEVFNKEVEERGSDYSSEEESEDEEKKWDC